MRCSRRPGRRWSHCCAGSASTWSSRNRQTCCGQPMVNTGYLDEAVPALRSFVEAFSGYDAIVTPSGSCAGSARHQHPIVAQRSGDASRGRRRRADGPPRLRADRVPRRQARRDRRWRLLPAPGDLSPHLSLAPDGCSSTAVSAIVCKTANARADQHAGAALVLVALRLPAAIRDRLVRRRHSRRE